MAPSRRRCNFGAAISIFPFLRRSPSPNPNSQIPIPILAIRFHPNCTAPPSSNHPSTHFTNQANFNENRLHNEKSHYPHRQNQVNCIENQPHKKESNCPQHQNRNFDDVVEEICRITRTQPRWEEILLSRFPNFDFSDPNLFTQVMKRHNNVFLSYRFYQWLVGSFPVLLGSLDAISCRVLFNGLVESKAGFVAKSLIETAVFKPEQGSFEGLIRCLCENGSMEETADLLSKIRVYGLHCPSLKTWNGGILGSMRVGRTDLVWRFYGEMMEGGVDPDGETVGYLVEALCMDNKVEAGYKLLLQVLEDGVTPRKMVFDRLISDFSKFKNYGRVSELLHLMIEKNKKPDVHTYQEVVNGLCKRRKAIEGYRIFNDLKRRGYIPHKAMYTAMIHGLCEMKWIGEARKLWFEMTQKGLSPDEYTYNVLIHGLFGIGNVNEAWKLHKEMCGRGLKHTTVSYNTLIQGLCMNGKANEAYELYRQMKDKGVLSDVITYNSLIHGFCREENATKSQEMFEELLAHGLQPSSFSYAPLIEQFCRIGSMQKATQLYEDMGKRGLEPTTYNHECIIAGLCKQGFAAEAMQWLSEMLNKDLIPRKETCERLAKCLYEKNRLDDAFFVIGTMFQLGHNLSEHLCHSLVSTLCGEKFSLVDTSLYLIFDSS